MGTCQQCKSYVEISNLTIIDQLSNDFIVVQGDYQHPLYGKVNILEYKEPKQFDFKLVHKLITFVEREDFQQALQYYEAKFYGFNHPNLLIIHAMQHRQIDQFFNTQYKLSLFLDYYETTLALKKEKYYSFWIPQLVVRPSSNPKVMPCPPQNSTRSISPICLMELSH